MRSQLEKEVRKKKDKIVQALLRWGMENTRDFPWRQNRTPYHVLVAEVILRRTTAKAASRIYEAFIRSYPNIKALSEADKGELERFLSPVGYHKKRAVMLKEIAQFISSVYDGIIPNKKEELMRIPHIGHYIAGAVLSLGYGIPSAMVDSNVERIIKRAFSKTLSTRRRDLDILKIADMLVPEKEHELFNFALLDLGALICRYDRAACPTCPIQEVCDTWSEKKERQVH
jgi:A/G-specific adenine glycosylase